MSCVRIEHAQSGVGVRVAGIERVVRIADEVVSAIEAYRVWLGAGDPILIETGLDADK